MQQSTPKHILVATDGSELSQGAVRHAAALAKALGAQITLLSVVVPLHSVGGKDGTYSNMPPDLRAYALEYLYGETERALSSGGALIELEGVPYTAVNGESQHAYQAIIDTATASGCDLIVMASHGRTGVAALVLGSETTKVLTHSAIPVLVCR
jgi:nucleotide-binding universal stress UspA family protein